MSPATRGPPGAGFSPTWCSDAASAATNWKRRRDASHGPYKQDPNTVDLLRSWARAHDLFTLSLLYRKTIHHCGVFYNYYPPPRRRSAVPGNYLKTGRKRVIRNVASKGCSNFRLLFDPKIIFIWQLTMENKWRHLDLWHNFILLAKFSLTLSHSPIGRSLKLHMQHLIQSV